MLLGGVAFALQILGRIDSTLRADRVRALYGDNREQVNLAAHLSDLDDCGQSCQASADYDDFWCCHLLGIQSVVCH